MNQNIKKSFFALVFLILNIALIAQDGKTVDGETIARYKNDYSYYIMIAFLIATVLAFIYAAVKVTRRTQENRKQTSDLDKVLYNAVAIEDEESIMLHHEYDGIRELDNHLPPWWLWLLYLNIIFAIVYILYYTVSGIGLTQEEEYESEMIYAKNYKEDLEKKMATTFDESNVAFLDAEADLAEGKELFNANCAVCHREDMGGGIGPNLVDNYWIHGGSPTEIYAVLKNGVLDKGMLAWKDQMTPFQMQRIMSYILSLKGTTPEVIKEPQGDLVE